MGPERVPLRRGRVSHRLSPAPASSKHSRGTRERSGSGRAGSISKHRSEARPEAYVPPIPREREPRSERGPDPELRMVSAGLVM